MNAVTDEAIVEAAAAAICVAVGGPCFAQEVHVEQARAALAAAVPLIREQIAREIEASSIESARGGNWDFAPNVKAAAARIARGVQS